MSTYLQDCLKRRLLLFTGKGGVGKSSVAWATALLLQRAGRSVTFASWNPLQEEDISESLGIQGIEWLHLNGQECFREYVLQILKFDKVYDAIFENKVLRTFMQVTPGLSEMSVSGKICQLVSKGKSDVVVVDLPASGHALSFFQSPLGVKKAFNMGVVHREASRVADMFESADTRLDFVAIPEEMSLVETEEFYEKLKALHPFSFGFLHVNQCLPAFANFEKTIVDTLPIEITSVLNRFEEQKEHQKEALTQIQNFSLPRHSIPKFGTESKATTIEKISEVLGKL